jgi:RecJ-like exonuclease
MTECIACNGTGVITNGYCTAACQICWGEGIGTGKVDPRNKAEIALDEAWERNRGEQ